MSSFIFRSNLRNCVVATPKRPLYALPVHQISARISTSAKNVSHDSQRREWLVIIPDRKGVLERRIEIRPRHSPNFVRLHNEGYVSWAGPVFSKPCVRKADREDRPFMGSIMVVSDVTPDNIYKRLSSDPFITEGIWDWENAKILPFKTVTRAP